MNGGGMNLSIFLPTDHFLKEAVVKIRGEGPGGEFCLKPKHVDYVTALIPSVFSYVTKGGKEQFLAVDQGILIKQGREVKIATRRAVSGELGQLSREVIEMLDANVEREKQNRSAVARLEAGFLKRFLDFSHRG